MTISKEGLDNMKQMTNAFKAQVLAATNTVLLLVDGFGVHLTVKQTSAVIAVVNIALGAAIWTTRKRSPKWIETATEVASDVQEVAGTVAQIKKDEVKLASTAKKPKAPGTSKNT